VKLLKKRTSDRMDHPPSNPIGSKSNSNYFSLDLNWIIFYQIQIGLFLPSIGWDLHRIWTTLPSPFNMQGIRIHNSNAATLTLSYRKLVLLDSRLKSLVTSTQKRSGQTFEAFCHSPSLTYMAQREWINQYFNLSEEMQKKRLKEKGKSKSNIQHVKLTN